MNHFIFPLRAYTEDTDYGGVVYHANYLKYFERARSEWAEQLGFGSDWQREQGIYFPVRHVRIDFLKPARLHDQLEVVSEIREIRSASLVYAQHLRLAEAKDTILSKADVRVACVGQDFRPRTLPDSLSDLLRRMNS